LVSAYHVYGSTGAGTIPGAVAAANLANGVRTTLFEMHLGGEGALATPTAYFDETFTFDHPALGESVAGDLIVGKFIIGNHVQYIDFVGV